MARSLSSLPSTRRTILETLKRRGEARAEELAVALGITPSAIRQHLQGLLADGLVTYRDEKGAPGRPRHLYSLTPASEALFPKMYSELTNELLEYVEDASPELLEQVFARRRDRRVDEARAVLDGRPLPQQVAALTEILDADGYLATWEETDDGGWRIIEHNCAILGVASKYGQACTSEIEFIRTVLPGADVQRVQHMMAGARRCAYEIHPR